MQFKVISALTFVTLVAAGAVPPPPGKALPPPGKTLPPPPKSLPPPPGTILPPTHTDVPPSPNTHLPARDNIKPANTNSGNTNPGNTNPGNTNSGNTGPAKTDPTNTNPTNTNPVNIAPPFPGNPLPTVGASKCATGHLQCCKSAQSPTAPAVAPLLSPHDISASSISGLVGVTCTEIPLTGDGAKTCSEQPVCCTDNSFGGAISLGCNLVNLSL